MATRKQTIVHARNLILALGAATSWGGCLQFKVDNKPPVAEVWVNGMSVAKSGNPLTTTTIPFSGSPVAVTLDGSKSSDSDGQVMAFKWVRTDVAAASRWADGGVPPPDSGLPVFHPSDDPPAMPQPQVMLGAGKYRYSLWVTDDHGAISAPATVTLQIGVPPPKFVPMPDATCAMDYMHPKKDCKDCTCTPNAMGGCVDEFNRCFHNTDAMFSTLCTAVVNCALAKKCSGVACFTAPNPCMAELDAAAMYMGGTADSCSMPAMADANPCAASAALLVTCATMTSMCATACK